MPIGSTVHDLLLQSGEEAWWRRLLVLRAPPVGKIADWHWWTDSGIFSPSISLEGCGRRDVYVFLSLPGAPICFRQITFPKDLPRDLQNKDGSEARTGFFSAEEHSDAQVSMRGSVGQQFRTGAMASFGLLAYLRASSEKKTLVFFYRPVFVTVVMRSEVVAVVPLHRSVLVTATVGVRERSSWSNSHCTPS